MPRQPRTPDFRIDVRVAASLRGGLHSELTVQPIGYLRTVKRVLFDAPHQPDENAEELNVLELLPDRGFEQAVSDLAGFDRVWLVWWFHRHANWRPMVLPPRGPQQRRGVFATRSPHRPNPLGITAVQLRRIDGLRLELGPCDLVDGTPVLDIKPYLAPYDSFPEASTGWLEPVFAKHDEPPRYTVSLAPLAQEQAAWLRETWRVDFLPRMTSLLMRDPSPHRTRRITRRGEHEFVIGCGAWRAVFRVNELAVEVSSFEPAYPERLLHRPDYNEVPDRDAQVAFLVKWPSTWIAPEADPAP